MSRKSYRLKCRNSKCQYEAHKYYPVEEFEKLQYGGDRLGISCFQCGYPRMIVFRSSKTVKDGFVPGFQRNIMKYCATYAEYKAHLKRMGIIELGYEDMPEKNYEGTQYWTDEKVKKMYDLLDPEDRPSDNEIKHLQSLHKDKDHLKDVGQGILEEGYKRADRSALSDKQRKEYQEAGDFVVKNIS